MHGSASISFYVFERDYLMSWILARISQVPLLHDTLVFKEGTVLRKCYFGDYRFSEDLDFTGLLRALTGNGMEDAIKEVCNIVRSRLKKKSNSADIRYLQRTDF